MGVYLDANNGKHENVVVATICIMHEEMPARAGTKLSSQQSKEQPSNTRESICYVDAGANPPLVIIVMVQVFSGF